jgi:hypothetical protein
MKRKATQGRKADQLRQAAYELLRAARGMLELASELDPTPGPFPDSDCEWVHCNQCGAAYLKPNYFAGCRCERPDCNGYLKNSEPPDCHGCNPDFVRTKDGAELGLTTQQLAWENAMEDAMCDEPDGWVSYAPDIASTYGGRKP